MGTENIQYNTGYHKGYADGSKMNKEQERLAEIGRATEKAFNTKYAHNDETVLIVSASTEYNGYSGCEELKSIEELLKWNRGLIE